MPLTIAIGYRAIGRTADPELLYCGNDGAAGAAAADAPPPGIIRTELIKSPIITRRRFFEAPAAPPAPAAEEAPAASPKRKPSPSLTDH